MIKTISVYYIIYYGTHRYLGLCRRRWRCSCSSFFANTVLLKSSHKGSFVSWCLEATMTKFGRCINELKIDLLKSSPLGMHTQGLEQNKEYVSTEKQAD